MNNNTNFNPLPSNDSNIILEEMPSPGVIKHHNSDDSNKNEYPREFLPIPLKKSHSLAEPSSSVLNNDLSFFQLRWIINKLIQMGLDLSVCYLILEQIQVENRDSDLIFSEILDKYEAYFERIREKASEPVILKKDLKIPRKSNENQVIIEMEEQKLDTHQVFLEKPEENLKICSICYEKKTTFEFHAAFPCGHVFCNSCVLAYIKEKISNAQILQIVCPDNCGYILTDDDVYLICSRNFTGLFDKYKRFKKLVILSQDPNVRWCVRAGCENVIKCKSNAKKITCEKCGQHICFECRLEWHEGLSCLQVLEREFANYSKEKLVKNCPKCKSRIEKNGGCNHMTCSRCGHQFCWLCRRKYTGNHYVWYNLFGCPKMMYQNINAKTNFCYQFTKNLLLFLMVLIAGPLAVISLILAILFVVLSTLPYIYKVYYYKEINIRHKIAIFFIFLLGIVLSPLIFVLLIMPGSCMIYKVYLDRK